MDTTTIQSRIDAIAKGMTAKALPQAKAEFDLRSHAEPVVFVSWASKATGTYADENKFFHGTMEAILVDAEAYVAGLPSPEEARMSAFLTALSDAIALGKQNDIDVEFVNPLVALMKRLSKNALQHHPAAAEAQP